MPEPTKFTNENITILEMFGDSREIGRHIGLELQSEINSLMQKGFEKYLPQASLIQNFIYSVVEKLVKNVTNDIPAEFMKEYTAMARSAEIDLEKILIWNNFDEILNRVHFKLLEIVGQMMGISWFTNGCSTGIIQKGNKSEKMLVGQNVDYPFQFLSGRSVLYKIHKIGKIRFICPLFRG